MKSFMEVVLVFVCLFFVIGYEILFLFSFFNFSFFSLFIGILFLKDMFLFVFVVLNIIGDFDLNIFYYILYVGSY